MSRLWFALVLVVFLSACAHKTLTKAQCDTGDWENIGLQDGAGGYATGPRLAAHGAACDTYKIKVNVERYMLGWNRGVLSYCTPAMGIAEGNSGRRYESVCPPKLEPAFLKGYTPAYAKWEIRHRYQVMKDRFNGIMDDLASERQKVAAAKDTNERLRATERINSLEKDKEEVSREMRVYEMKHAHDLVD